MNRKKIALIALSLPMMFSVGLTTKAPSENGGYKQTIQRADATTRDVTTSNVYTDLKLLCNEGKDFSLYGSSKTCPTNESSMYRNFMFITGRPYQSDLYLYFFFENSTEHYIYNPDFKFGIELCTGTGEVPASPSFSYKQLTMVGNAKDSGNMHWAKYKVTEAFNSVTIGSANYYIINSFGLYDGTKFTSEFDIKATQTFTYTDDKYDITSTLKKPGCLTIEDHKAYQMFVANANQFVLGFNVPMVEENGSYIEADVGLFNTSVEIDQILGIELNYDYLTFNKQAVCCNNTPNISSGHGDRVYRVPTTQYEETKDEVVSRVSVNKWILPTDSASVNINTQVGNIPNFWSDHIAHKWTSLVDTRNYPSDIDDIQKKSLEDNKGGRRFAYLAETGLRKWDWSKKITYANGWDSFWGANPMETAICHQCDGQIISRVAFMTNGVVYDYNAWDQPVNPTWSYVVPVQTISVLDWLKYKAKTSDFWAGLKRALIIAGSVVAGLSLVFVSIWLIDRFAPRKSNS